MRPQLGMLAGAVALLTLPGCEGSDAAPAAGVDSCRIAQRLVSLPTTIPESSGAAVGANRSNIVWTHNDSGGGAELFGVNAFG
ncbi:MAG TPA: hypothetical protein VMN39_10175, partial [Longimicrobiaceae bacterium]|nr:hypothetical protein [Longimicrobiaceae bacterium]